MLEPDRGGIPSALDYRKCIAIADIGEALAELQFWQERQERYNTGIVILSINDRHQCFSIFVSADLASRIVPF